MAGIKIGDRVGAIESSNEGRIKFYGYGTYQGRLVPKDKNVQFMGVSLKAINQPNHCIKLDNGELVWGCECWWGSEEKVKEMLAKAKTITFVPILRSNPR